MLEIEMPFASWQRWARRAILADAINGTSHDRYSYAVSRAAVPNLKDLAFYGSAVCAPDEVMKRASVIYGHVTAAAQRNQDRKLYPGKNAR